MDETLKEIMVKLAARYYDIQKKADEYERKGRTGQSVTLRYRAAKFADAKQVIENELKDEL